MRRYMATGRYKSIQLSAVATCHSQLALGKMAVSGTLPNSTPSPSEAGHGNVSVRDAWNRCGQKWEHIAQECLVPSDALKVACKQSDREGRIYARNRQVVMACDEVAVRDVHLENRLGAIAIVVDLCVTDNTGTLLVVIAVTHYVDEEKRAKIEALGHRCLEIDLKGLDRHCDPDALQRHLLSANHARWVYYPDVSYWHQMLSDDLQSLVQTANRRIAERTPHRSTSPTDLGSDTEQLATPGSGSAEELAQVLWRKNYSRNRRRSRR